VTGALFWAAVRERLLRPVVIVLLVVGSASFMLAPLVIPDPDLVDPSSMMTLLFAVGLIGRDVSSGTLALVFTRPVRRWQFALTRWLAAAAPASALSALHLIVQFFALSARGLGVPGSALAAKTFEATTACFGLSAVLLALSTMAPGVADLGLWIALRLGIDVIRFVGASQRVREQLEGLTAPSVEWAIVGAGGTDAWFALASYASNVTLLLAVAVWLLNRKELSYATG
jgi:hypothetical protein